MNDLIDRQTMIDLIEDDSSNGVYSCFASYKDAQKFKQKVMDLSPAQPERKRGRWIYGEDNLGTGRDGWFCSKCGHFEMWDYSADMKSAELNLPNYCPNCGADMRGGENG